MSSSRHFNVLSEYIMKQQDYRSTVTMSRFAKDTQEEIADLQVKKNALGRDTPVGVGTCSFVGTIKQLSRLGFARYPSYCTR